MAQRDFVQLKSDALHDVSTMPSSDTLTLIERTSSDKSKVLDKLVKVVLLAGAFMALEVIGGLISQSIAILSDAAHMFSDLLSFSISIFSVWISTFPANNYHSFGYQRAGVLGALASTVLIWILTAFLVYSAIDRMLNLDQVELNAPVMLITATFGLITNLIMAKVLHGTDHAHGHGHGHCHGHSHSHGHKHDHKEEHHKHIHTEDDHKHDHEDHPHNSNPVELVTSDPESPQSGIPINMEESKQKSHSHGHAHGHSHGHGHGHKHDHSHSCDGHTDLNIRAATIHILGDILQSIGVIIGSLAIQFSPEKLKVIDPILTLLFSVIVLFTTKRIFQDCLRILMQSVPPSYKVADITELIEGIPNVVKVSNLHIWSLTMDKHILSAHVVTDGDSSVTLRKITELCRKLKIEDSTIQIETINHIQDDLDLKQDV